MDIIYAFSGLLMENIALIDQNVYECAWAGSIARLHATFIGGCVSMLIMLIFCVGANWIRISCLFSSKYIFTFIILATMPEVYNIFAFVLLFFLFFFLENAIRWI